MLSYELMNGQQRKHDISQQVQAHIQVLSTVRKTLSHNGETILACYFMEFIDQHSLSKFRLRIISYIILVDIIIRLYTDRYSGLCEWIWGMDEKLHPKVSEVAVVDQGNKLNVCSNEFCL